MPNVDNLVCMISGVISPGHRGIRSSIAINRSAGICELMVGVSELLFLFLAYSGLVSDILKTAPSVNAVVGNVVAYLNGIILCSNKRTPGFSKRRSLALLVK